MPTILAKFYPARFLIGSLMGTILIGTLLLSLPVAQKEPVSFIDTLFTAVSATCVTGLMTVPITQFTLWGHWIILLLLQIGGLGLVTLGFFLVFMLRHPEFSLQLVAGQVLEIESWQRTKQILRFIVGFTLICELIGAGFFYWLLPYSSIEQDNHYFYALFHAVSSFCDSGFTLFPGGMEIFKHDILFLLVTTILMFCGGFGFLTWHELLSFARTRREGRRFALSLQSKIILYGTLIIIGGGTLLFLMLERHNGLSSLTPVQQLINALFTAVSSRSSGFSTINPIHLQFATIYLIMVISFIGSSPGSTGSGIKITTIAILLAVSKAAITKRNAVELRGRRIPTDQVYKAFAIVGLSVGWIIIATFCLLITEKTFDCFDVVFEVVSAFATLGLTLGITPLLSCTGKCFIIASMIVGRLGALTLILAIMRRHKATEYSYPEERVMIG